MEQETFKTQVIPIRDRLYRFARRFLHNQEEAEDATQDVLIKLWNHRAKLDSLNSIEAFAMVMTRNLCLDRLKSKKQLEGPLKMEPVEQRRPDREMEHAESMLQIKGLMDRLPEQQKTVMHLRDIESYSFEEIAEVTGMKLNAIRVNLSRARQKVREGLGKAKYYEIQRNQ